MAWTTKQAAEYLGVSLSFISRLCRKGLIKAEMFGRDWSIDPESVKAFKEKPKGKVGRPRKNS